MNLACTCKEYYPPELKTSGEDACSNGGGTCYGLQENGHKYASRNGPIDGPDDQPYRGCLFREKGMKDEADKCKYFPSFNSCPIYAPSICHTTGSNTIDDFCHRVFNSKKFSSISIIKMLN